MKNFVENHTFIDFNNKPILSHHDDIITFSFPTNTVPTDIHITIDVVKNNVTN